VGRAKIVTSKIRSATVSSDPYSLHNFAVFDLKHVVDPPILPPGAKFKLAEQQKNSRIRLSPEDKVILTKQQMYLTAQPWEEFKGNVRPEFLNLLTELKFKQLYAFIKENEYILVFRNQNESPRIEAFRGMPGLNCMLMLASKISANIDSPDWESDQLINIAATTVVNV